MCTGYWESCGCEDCNKVKELMQDRDWFWDNKEEREEIERELEKNGIFSLNI